MNLLLATLWVKEEDAVIDYSYKSHNSRAKQKEDTQESRKKIKLKVQVNALWMNGQRVFKENIFLVIKECVFPILSESQKPLQK